jgi:hypothetical protein
LRARIGDGAKRGAANISHIGKPSDKASGDSGRNPLGLARFWLEALSPAACMDCDSTVHGSGFKPKS